MIYNFGDVVLVPFPFTNQVASKKVAPKEIPQNLMPAYLLQVTNKF